MSSPIIPDFLAQMLSPFRKLFHAASWDSFRAIILGLLLELSNSSLVRASLVSGPEYNWRRTHDFMRRNRWSHQKTIATHCSTTVQSLYGDSLPEKLFWAADAYSADIDHLIRRKSITHSDDSDHLFRTKAIALSERSDAGFLFSSENFLFCQS